MSASRRSRRWRSSGQDNSALEAPKAAAGAQQDLGGEEVFNMACVACHGAGVAGAPKFGDTAAWAPRIAKGADTLHKHALEGFQGQAGFMPAEGRRDRPLRQVDHERRRLHGERVEVRNSCSVAPPAPTSAIQPPQRHRFADVVGRRSGPSARDRRSSARPSARGETHAPTGRAPRPRDSSSAIASRVGVQKRSTALLSSRALSVP